MPVPKKLAKQPQRCDWAQQHPIFWDYHDHEWGVPCYDSEKMFSMLCLEIFQAGLSWRTVLEKRPAFAKHFAHFQPNKVARFSEAKIQKLLLEPSIIRNQAKIRATIHNAQQYLNFEANSGSFSDYFWQFVDGKPIVNRWLRQEQLPVKTPLSETISKDLKRRGYKFIGPTIVYSFMQAVGLIDDHLRHCFCAKSLNCQ